MSNTATVTTPAGVTELDPASNTATDLDRWYEIFADDFEDGTIDAWLAP